MVTKNLAGYWLGIGIGLAMVLIGLVARQPQLVVLGNLLAGACHLLGLIVYFEALPEDTDVLFAPRRISEARVEHRRAA